MALLCFPKRFASKNAFVVVALLCFVLIPMKEEASQVLLPEVWREHRIFPKVKLNNGWEKDSFSFLKTLFGNLSIRPYLVGRV